MKQSIKITNAALADWGEGDIILRGVVDPTSLSTLKVASYQREVQGRKHIRGIMKGFESRGSVPDVELGMRGHSYTEAGGDFFLLDDVFIIDGLQRTTAAMEVLQKGVLPRLGCMIHFDTTEPWERTRFELLNTHRSKVASSVLINNLAADNEAVALLKLLCKDSSFALANRVAWKQKMCRGQLVQAQLLLKTVGVLHRRFAPGLVSSRYMDVCTGLEKLYKQLGRTRLRENIKRFFETVDECYDIRNVQYASLAPYLKTGFLRQLASVFAAHEDFWNDSEFVISTDLKRKLKLFRNRMDDRNVAGLCGASGAAGAQLYTLLVEHINSGKRNRRLSPFVQPEFVDVDDEDEEDEEAPTVEFSSFRVGATGAGMSA